MLVFVSPSLALRVVVLVLVLALVLSLSFVGDFSAMRECGVCAFEFACDVGGALSSD